MTLTRLTPLVAALCLAACATAPDGAATGLSVADRLYLGGSSRSGPVTEDDWTRFVAEVVTPLFPDGLTLWRAHGQWRGTDGAITREAVLVIEILHPADPGTDARLDTIARTYRERFGQEAVLRATSPVRARMVR